MSNIYLISDTHFAHKNIMKYENRPFKDLIDMREKLILNWNMLVKPEDTVIHLGDFGMCNKDAASEILSRLNGHKILIKGNHDSHGDQWFLDAGFEEVHKYLVLHEKDKTILCTHQPYKIPEELKNKYDLHLYGHVHGKGNEPGLYPTVARNGACMCVERWDYKPVLLDEVIDLCASAPYSFNEAARNQVESDSEEIENEKEND